MSGVLLVSVIHRSDDQRKTVYPTAIQAQSGMWTGEPGSRAAAVAYACRTPLRNHRKLARAARKITKSTSFATGNSSRGEVGNSANTTPRIHEYSGFQ